MSDTYNGWANWETWQVPLWINNQEPLYREKMKFLENMARQYRPKWEWNAAVESFCRDIFPNGTPDMEDTTDMDCVNWGEIADHWQDEADEIAT